MHDPRPYNGYDDLRKMQALSQALWQARPYGTHHPRDVEWWFFYNPQGEPLEETTFLWEDERGGLMAWLTSIIAFGEYDLFVHPAYAGTPLEAEMMAWGEAFVRANIDPAQCEAIEAHGIFEHDIFRRELLASRGYEATPDLYMFGCDLTQELPAPTLPEGYRFLEAMRPELAPQRANLHASAFVPSRMTPAHYAQFMQTAPSYDPAHDVVVVNDAGDMVAFAMTWCDDVLKVGEFEPVGTHADYQRRGLGKATLHEGLRRLKAAGMREATVCCEANLPQNVAFYESAGFAKRNATYRYRKLIQRENPRA
jgi:GNAT superfamily N-acetyltransferase